MRSRTLFFAFVVLATTFTLSGTASAQTGLNCEVPDPAPGFDVLYPTSSTSVLPGETVALAFDYQNVQPYPWTNFYFRSSDRDELIVEFNPKQANTITIPADWTPGQYRLFKTETFNMIGWTGTQTRHHQFIGLGPDGATVKGHSCINLWPLDIRVREGA